LNDFAKVVIQMAEPLRSVGGRVTPLAIGVRELPFVSTIPHPV